MLKDRGLELALAGVAVLYILTQFAVFTFGEYYINRDEAIYLTQVVPGEVAHDMAMHRTRGMSFLVLPIAPWAHSLVVLRTWMVILGAVGIFLAFRPWTRVIGWGAVAAAFVFAAYWVNVFFGAQLYPNFFAALTGVAAAGHFVSYLREERRGDLIAVGVFIALMALIRPLDSVLVASGMWFGLLLFRRSSFVPVTVTLAVGGLAGFAPWLVEGWIRFELLPWDLLFEAEETGASGLEADNLSVYLNNTDGPVRCVDDCPSEALEDGITMRVRELLILAGLLGASLLSLVGSPRRVSTQSMYVAGLSLTALLAYYLTCDCAINLRYLEPAWAFLALMVGGGLATAWRLGGNVPRGVRGGGAALALVLMAGWGGYQATLAGDSVVEGFGSRERAYVLAQALDERAAGRPCAAAVSASDRQIQFYSDCIAVSYNRGSSDYVQNSVGGTTSLFDLNLLADDGYQIYAIARPRHVPDDAPVRDWEVEDISSDVLGSYLLFTAPPDVEMEVRYRDGYTPEDAGPP